MSDDLIEALEAATDDPPRETMSADIDMTVMPSTEDQLDEAGAADHFVRRTVADVTIDGVGVEIQVAEGDGILVAFEDGERVLLGTTDIVTAAATAASESEVLGE